MHVVCICITNSASNSILDNHLLMVRCMTDIGKKENRQGVGLERERTIYTITKYYRDGHHYTCMGL